MDTYEKKYKEIVGQIKKAYLYAQTDSTKAVLEEIIPELAESEDEKIKKRITLCLEECVHSDVIRDYEKDECIAWLEKQGEHANFRNKIQVGDKVTRNEDGILVNLSQLKRVAKPSEKRGEKEPTQSPKAMTKLEEKLSSLVVAAVHTYCEKNLLETPHFVGLILGDKMAKEWSKEILTLAEEELRKMRQKPADKVEPKFHEGEWITNGDYIWKILEVRPLDYTLLSQDDNIVVDTISHVDKQFHSFTIADAKDGDVLADYAGVILFRKIGNERYADVVDYYCVANTNGRFEIQEKFDYWGEANDAQLHPATKEQRDTLLKAMANAGYTFDFERKKLKKIEPKTEENKGNLGEISPSSEWSEEEEAAALGTSSLHRQGSKAGTSRHGVLAKTTTSSG